MPSRVAVDEKTEFQAPSIAYTFRRSLHSEILYQIYEQCISTPLEEYPTLVGKKSGKFVPRNPS